jgi:hypothetical protein
MKTQSISTLAALLGVAVTLNVSALAGPDPSTRFPLQTVSQPTKSQVSVAFGGHQAEQKSKAVESSSKLTQTPNAHGGITFSYRGVSAETW